MLTLNELKNLLHRDISNADKLMLTIGTFDKPCQIREIKDQAKAAGFKVPTSWNPSRLLKNTNGKAIHTPLGWELTDIGKQHLVSLGGANVNLTSIVVASDLRKLLEKMPEGDAKDFVSEAVQAYEFQMFRSAIVMSWLAAVHILKVEIVKNHMSAFNSEARRVNQKWKIAKNTDDIGRMSEGEFLDRIETLGVIGKNVKAELKDCLDRRNGCGHPNSLKVGSNTVTHHIEILLLNVFNRFC